MSKEIISKLSVVCLSAVIGCVTLIVGISICKNIFSEGFLFYHNSITASRVIGIFLCSFIGIAAGITGIFLRRQKRIDKVICSICTLLCIVFILLMFLPVLINSREKARRISCASNLRCFMLAFRQYAADYAGNYPSPGGAAGFEVLRKNDYLTDYAVFTCPSTKTVQGRGEQPLTEEIVDYVYIGGLNTKSDPKQPLMYDKANNHGYYGNVLFADGTVQGIYGNPWPQNIKK